METPIIISIIISSLALVVSLFSYFVQKKQNENSDKELKVKAFKDILNSHRELYFEILKNDEFASKVADSGDVALFKKNMLGTILINHCQIIFETAKNKLVSDDDWVGLQNDIKDFFTWSIVRDRWVNNRQFYPRDFQRFVDNLTKDGRFMKIYELKSLEF